MRKNRLSVTTMFVVCLMFFSNAQESVNSSGGDGTSSGGTVSFSVGQVNYTSENGSDGTSLEQGVQHAYVITTSIKEAGVILAIDLFPNPTSDYLTLSVKENNKSKLNYQLFDAQGRLLKTGFVTGQQALIDMSILPSATYLFNVTQDNKQVQSFTIIKK